MAGNKLKMTLGLPVYVLSKPFQYRYPPIRLLSVAIKNKPWAFLTTYKRMGAILNTKFASR